MTKQDYETTRRKMSIICSEMPGSELNEITGDFGLPLLRILWACVHFYLNDNCIALRKSMFVSIENSDLERYRVAKAQKGHIIFFDQSEERNMRKPALKLPILVYMGGRSGYLSLPIRFCSWCRNSIVGMTVATISSRDMWRQEQQWQFSHQVN